MLPAAHRIAIDYGGGEVLLHGEQLPGDALLKEIALEVDALEECRRQRLCSHFKTG